MFWPAPQGMAWGALPTPPFNWFRRITSMRTSQVLRHERAKEPGESRGVSSNNRTSIKPFLVEPEFARKA